jgi:peroxiredoxin Q/BCP
MFSVVQAGTDVLCRASDRPSLPGVTAMRSRIALPVFGSIVLVIAGSLSAQDEKKVDLSVGDLAPVFSATDDQGKVWKSADLVGKKYVVVYFFPADFTSGCRAQAQKFRDNMNALNEKGIVFVGVSGDTVFTHALFKKTEKLNFTLLADEDGAVAKKFGVPLGKGGEVRAKDNEGKIAVLKRNVTASRWTFIIGLDGKVLYKNTKVDPAADSKQVGEFIEKVAKK